MANGVISNHIVREAIVRGQTDSSGNFTIPDSYVNPSTGNVLSVRTNRYNLPADYNSDIVGCLLTIVFTHSNYVIRVINVNAASIPNAKFEFVFTYILY